MRVKEACGTGTVKPGSERPILDLVREWKIVGAKLKLDLLIEGGDDDINDRLIDAAENRRTEILEEPSQRRTDDPEAAQAILLLVMERLKEPGGYDLRTEVDLPLLFVVNLCLARYDDKLNGRGIYAQEVRS